MDLVQTFHNGQMKCIVVYTITDFFPMYVESWSYFPHSSLLHFFCCLAYLSLFNTEDNTVPVLLACDIQYILTCDAG